ncbi:hypothetical protein [Sphingobacterium rhinopitheci]|uniref:hypothetical protein n=1 Tax=Sphingobacterium rhinopitheci TaxID=2781960 RepID=UPI001F529856|nr:hypothetical protein [Sphingobacterium rhinopitheci]MCI0922067.1 hypothetical protein [Sphingobacterium rhinopitheci]
MKIKFLLLSLGLTLGVSTSNAQDLIRKVPANAKFVVTFNNKAFLTHLNANELNSTLSKIGFFDKILDNNSDHSIDDLGIDLNNKAYVYGNGTDSIQYVGGLFPMANRKQFEAIVTKDSKIEIVDNLPTIYSEDRTLRMSWDDNTIYFLTGLSMGSYFDKEEVKERYGLLSNYDYSDWAEAEADTVSVEFDEWGEFVVDSTSVADISEVVISEDELNEVEMADEIDQDEYDIVDSVLAQDEYADDYYLQYDSINRHNDSLKNVIIGGWLNTEFSHLISGNLGSYSTKKIKPISSNTLINLHIDSLGVLFGALYTDNPIWGNLGYYQSMMGDVNQEYTNAPYYGMESLDAQIDVIGNSMKLSSTLGFDKKLVKQYKEIYRKGVNPKFYNFLDKDVVAFFSVNANTEAYLKALPSMISRNYSTIFPYYNDFVDLGASIFEVLLDEKAIGKVYKGDNLLVLNGLTKSEVEYTDYEYDEDYNYTEVVKTKMETIPQFMWMFSSDDTRIFDRMIQVGLNREYLEEVYSGLYRVVEVNSSGIQIYLQIKDGIVFVSDDLMKMQDIASNKVNTKGVPKYVALAKNNVAALVVNTKRIPVLLKELDIPLSDSLKGFVGELNQYGDFSIISPGIVGNAFKSEAKIDFPKSKANALQYLFDVISRKQNIAD